MKITNKDVIQSYIVTAARYDFNIYEKRILYRLVEMCQCQLEGKKLDKNFRIDKLLFEEMREVTIPISAFLKDEKDENYSRVKDALKRLRNKTIDYETKEKPWKLIGLIEMPEFDTAGNAKFKLHKEIYEAILNFSKGFRKYELKTAMTFDTAYAMRFYELISEKAEPITYTVTQLKIMFGLENKYKESRDFIKRVVKPAKKELDEKAPYSFTYKTNKISKKVVSITFIPYYIPKNRDENLEHRELQKQVSIKWDLDKITIDYLKQNYFFDDDEIKNNLRTFIDAEKKLDLLVFLSSKKRVAETKPNPKGWIINAIKGELEKFKQPEKKL